MKWALSKNPPKPQHFLTTMKVSSHLSIPISSLSSKTRSLFSSSASISSLESATSNEIHSIIASEPAMETPLEACLPFLSASVVDSVVEAQPNVELGFRFFIWAMRRRRLRSWFSHNLMIETLSKSPDSFTATWDLLEQLRERGLLIVPQAFSVLISAYSASGMAEKAIESFCRMHEFQSRPNTFTYNTVLRILIKEEVPQLAMAVYYQMLKSDCRANCATFSILIDGLCKTGKSQEALFLFDKMTHTGISPNTMIYTIVLSSHCQANRTDEAYKLYCQMKDNGCAPDQITHNAMLDGFCRIGRVDEALNFVRKEGFELRLNAYSCLIDGLVKVGRFDEACSYYQEMLERKIVPDCVLYTIMIKGYSEVGDVEKASELLSEMTDRGFVPDTFCYNTMIKGLCDAGLLDEAQSLKLEISSKGGFPDSATYTIMICGLCKKGMVNEAKLIFDEMEKLGCLPTVMTFNALIDGLCKKGQTDKALILFYKMEVGRDPSLFLRLSQGADPVTNSEALQARVQQLCENGLVLEAYRLLRRLANSGVLPDVITYNILIRGFCRAHDINGAFNLFNGMQLKGYTPDAVTYLTLIEGLWQANKETDAFHVFELLKKNGPTPNDSIYKTLMLALCRKGRIWRAFTLWVEYLKSNVKCQLSKFISEAEKHFEYGFTGEAMRCLLEMDFQLKISDPSSYGIFIIGFCKAGRVDDALNMFYILHDYSVDITRKSCEILISCLCRGGKVPLAVDLFLKQLDKGFPWKRSVCNKLLTQLLYQNRREDALIVMHRLKYAGYDLDLCLYQTTRSLLYNLLQR